MLNDKMTNTNTLDIRKASSTEIDAIVQIYDLIHRLEEEGQISIGWNREIYPTKKTAEDALEDDSLFVMRIEDKVVAAAIINQLQPSGYNEVDWKFTANEDKVGVLHTLVVHPSCINLGLGKKFVSYFEKYCKELGYEVVRLDTQTKNIKPLKLYPKLGYTLTAIKDVTFQNLPNKVELAMFEKKL